jgi:LacI family transcriptional regulator
MTGDSKKQITSLKELADKLNLSVTTVSRVLNGKAATYRISSSTQENVLNAARKFNYVPNRLARSLKLDKTETIGLIIPDISNPFFADIAKSIEAEARNKGYSIIFGDSMDNIETEEKLLQLLQSQKVDGIIVAPVGTKQEHLLHAYNEGLPIVVIDRFFRNSELPYITSDNYKGAYDAVCYLIAMGHRKIACIQGIHDSLPNIERVEGYKKALKDNSIPFNPLFLLGNSFSKQNGYDIGKTLFSLDTPPTAIFALSNLISLGVLEAACELNKSVPSDFSLISFDEQPYSAYLATSMTTIDQQKHEIGIQAVHFLVNCIDNNIKEKPFSLRLPTKMIKRNSVMNIN